MKIVRKHESMPDFFRVRYEFGGHKYDAIDFNYSNFFRYRYDTDREVEIFINGINGGKPILARRIV